MRLYYDQPWIEIEATVGPIEELIDGKEIITKWETDLSTEKCVLFAYRWSYTI